VRHTELHAVIDSGVELALRYGDTDGIAEQCRRRSSILAFGAACEGGADAIAGRGGGLQFQGSVLADSNLHACTVAGGRCFQGGVLCLSIALRHGGACAVQQVLKGAAAHDKMRQEAVGIRDKLEAVESDGKTPRADGIPERGPGPSGVLCVGG